LYCGTSADSVPDFVSALPGRDQEILISPYSPVAYPNGVLNTTTNTTEGADPLLLQCLALLQNFLPTPVEVTFTATAGSTITPLVATEAATAEGIYKTCCTEAGSCEPWNQATEAAGQDFTTGEVFTDLCNIDNNLCNEAGQLTVLNFDGYGLSCDVTNLNFTGFTSLVSLSLARNNLTGDFEKAVEEWSTQLSTLKLLDVGENSELSGTLTADTTITSTPTGLCAFTANGLEWLGIYKTQISGKVPSCLFGSESVLTEFLGGSSSISGALPESISTCESLAVLSLDRTNLTGTVPKLPTGIVKLNLTENGHTGPVPDLSAATSLTTVDLSNNMLTGPVPASAVDHPSLKFLDLRANNLDGMPTQWTSTPSSANALKNSPPMDTLMLSFNPLSNTPFPAGLATYPNLTFLELANTNITGQLPEVAAGDTQWKSLDQLYLQNNQMDGAIPESWQNAYLFSSGNFDNYRHAFVLSNNSFSGNIPQFLGEAYAGTVINLAGNNFTNACDPEFEGLGACDDPTKQQENAQDGDYADDYNDPTAEEDPSSKTGEGDETASPDESSSSSGGLSSGAVAGIVIAVLAVVGAGGYVIYRRRRHAAGAGGGSAGRFTRFEDEGGFVEMGGRNTSSNVYNPQLAP
jgi:hypothetical protein